MQNLKLNHESELLQGREYRIKHDENWVLIESAFNSLYAWASDLGTPITIDMLEEFKDEIMHAIEAMILASGANPDLSELIKIVTDIQQRFLLISPSIFSPAKPKDFDTKNSHVTWLEDKGEINL